MPQSYNDWLTPERLVDIEAAWSKLDRSEVIVEIERHEPKSVIEFCCGTGWIPKGLDKDITYLGLDANPHCLELAREKNPTREFMQRDLLKDPLPPTFGTFGVSYFLRPFDMSVAFSCLKHFELSAWDRVYGVILKHCKRSLTTIFITPKDEDGEKDGFVHTSVTRERVERVCAENKHRLVQVFMLPPMVGAIEPLVLTERIDL